MKKAFVTILLVGVLCLPSGWVAASSSSVPAWVKARVEEGHRCRRWENLFRRHGLPVVAFTYIAWRESRCNPVATNGRWDKYGNLIFTKNSNGTYDSGLLQINSGWKSLTVRVCGAKEWDRRLLFDPKCNVKVAEALFAEDGLAPWGF